MEVSEGDKIAERVEGKGRGKRMTAPLTLRPSLSRSEKLLVVLMTEWCMGHKTRRKFC